MHGITLIVLLTIVYKNDRENNRHIMIKMTLGFVVPCIFCHSNKTPNKMQQSNLKFYCLVVQTLFNMFRALLCPSSGARQTAVAASGFRMNVEVFSAVVGLTTCVCKPEDANTVQSS